MSTLVGLAQDITSRTALLAHLYHQAGLEGPTWDEEAPTDFQTGVVHPEEIAEARYALVDSLLDMMRLAMGPREVLKSLISSAVPSLPSVCLLLFRLTIRSLWISEP